MTRREITRADILPLSQYAAERKERRARLVAHKRTRRVEVGPLITFYFESYETMWHQVHEMLFIEKGGEAQIADELAAYNPLIPQGRDLVATMMIEVDDAQRRPAILARLGGIEDHIALEFSGRRVRAEPADDAERTTPDGKTSSVHFLRFVFTDADAAAFKAASGQVVLALSHPAYGHMAVMPQEVRAALAADLG